MREVGKRCSYKRSTVGPGMTGRSSKDLKLNKVWNAVNIKLS